MKTSSAGIAAFSLVFSSTLLFLFFLFWYQRVLFVLFIVRSGRNHGKSDRLNGNSGYLENLSL